MIKFFSGKPAHGLKCLSFLGLGSYMKNHGVNFLDSIFWAEVCEISPVWNEVSWDKTPGLNFSLAKFSEIKLME